MARVTSRLIDWWRRRRWTAPRYVQVAYCDSRADLPTDLKRRTIAIVGSPDRPKWAIFACPCGTGHDIALNLAPTRRPAWTVNVGHGRATLHPSVDSVTDERRCHFWVRNGRVSWARERDQDRRT
ncbi:DUF6527 family protein [Patulibacter defluvii]|uniref:DUF6527 family protein n=1 Tax=Patulibacter defluvii TaxID=3095358 RepID=UPI0035C924BF